MGFFDQIIKNIAGGQGKSDVQGPESQVLNVVLQWVQEQGGFQAVLGKLQQGGLGAILSSWLGQGANASVEASQLQSAFGNGELQSLADKLGTNTEGAVSQLQQVLPELIDKASPQGSLNTEQLGSLVDNIFGRK
ncbi:hypothetical protein BL250_16705 [Erwinia sp. OLTSP20]|uniref:YidB family protein n=1 Tax=unclassified Erwinia TaxID=2622719 RepID=UPI000C174074|nr:MULTISPECIES: YidB family protein [unclassified Erwinia]PIJ48975.1 hypothetical protein BV501_14780 [Erwinia sp. OAMSP11]PIJ74628.1 hypothetical protein BK416_03985 [Erwinia sp. OLSSP12]PIJ79659.1 hypothetical protein BLD47_13405 [Erwinia sp. OLCASP19]PIJ80444.1 hypothetical protein BLD46_15250 [Erwinia sp. OLMTSP26]PIJ82559.1 hypothetical protein BLD49_15145 [Erwinia sp. OLMDSP33]